MNQPTSKIIMKRIILWSVFLFILGCQSQPEQSASNDEIEEESSEESPIIEATSLDGRQLIQRAADSAALATYLPKIESLTSKTELSEDDWVDLGNHYASLNRYNNAIAVYTNGLNSFPDSYKLLRFRAHRQLSIRQIEPALADLQKALELMGEDGGAEMEYYPNGKEKGTYRYWVWYHIGLGHYFNSDFEKAAEAFQQCINNADTDNNRAGAVEWTYNSLQLAGDTEGASAALASFEPDPDADYAYARRLMMHKGLVSPDELVDLSKDGADWSGSEMTTAYGVANWHLFSGDTTTAMGIYKNVLKNPIWNYWAYIAAETALVD